jgi:hypothetical protein
MGRKSKSKQSRQANALKAAAARRTTVEEVPDEGDSISSHADEATGISCNDRGCSDSSHLHSHSDAAEANDWDFDLGNELPDADCDAIEDSVDLDLDREIVLAPEISDEAELDTFSQVLFEAQAAAQKAEHKREQSRKRPKTYSGNAARTLRAHKKRGRDLASKGFLSVFDFIKAKKQSSTSSQLGSDSASASQPPSTPADDAASISDHSTSESSDDGSGDEIIPELVPVTDDDLGMASEGINADEVCLTELHTKRLQLIFCTQPLQCMDPS